MSDTVVIDTNVLLVANGADLKVSGEGRTACVNALRARQQAGKVAIDDRYRILGEYLNKTQPNQPKGAGDSFLKWLLQNQRNPGRVALVPITEIEPDRFAEFPDPELESRFDPPDRKFVALANAHPAKPPIWQAADSKWLDWWGRCWRQKESMCGFCVRPTPAVFTRRSFPASLFRLCRLDCERTLSFPAHAPSRLARGRCAAR